MKILNSKIMVSFFIVSLFFSSCKDDKDYIEENDFYKKNGYVKVNLKGTSLEGYSIDDSFTARKYSIGSEGNASSYSENNNEYRFNIYRFDDLAQNNSISIYFEMNKSDKTIDNESMDVNFRKIIDENTILDYNVNTWQFTEIEAQNIDNVVFDTATGDLSGNYSMTVIKSKNDVERSVMIDGEFDLKVYLMADK